MKKLSTMSCLRTWATSGVIVVLLFSQSSCQENASLKTVNSAPSSWEEIIDQARWAQNAHNMQSWRIVAAPERQGLLWIYLEPSRSLPESDPPSRQLLISIGAFLGAGEEAAAVRSLKLSWRLFPDNPWTPNKPFAEPVAEMSLSPASAKAVDLPVDALSAATVKYRVESMTLPDPFYRSQETRFSDHRIHLEWVTDRDQVNQLVNIAVSAFDLEMDIPAKRGESIVNTRYTSREESNYPWGITLNPNFTKAQLPFVQFFVSIFGQTPKQYAEKAKSDFKEAMKSVQALMLVVTDGNTPDLQVETGVFFQKAEMEIVHRGGRLLPLSQALQEYPEMGALYREIHLKTAKPGQTVQMLTALLKPRGDFFRSPRLAVEQIFQK